LVGVVASFQSVRFLQRAQLIVIFSGALIRHCQRLDRQTLSAAAGFPTLAKPVLTGLKNGWLAAC
jgi:hypothetical protein